MRKRWRATPRGQIYQKNTALRNRSGWTLAMRDAALEAQQHRCAICPRVMDEVNCDHTERDGVKIPRALLCRACNLSLGYYEGWQKPAGLRLPAYDDYLMRYS